MYENVLDVMVQSSADYWSFSTIINFPTTDVCSSPESCGEDDSPKRWIGLDDDDDDDDDGTLRFWQTTIVRNVPLLPLSYLRYLIIRLTCLFKRMHLRLISI